MADSEALDGTGGAAPYVEEVDGAAAAVPDFWVTRSCSPGARPRLESGSSGMTAVRVRGG